MAEDTTVPEKMATGTARGRRGDFSESFGLESLFDLVGGTLRPHLAADLLGLTIGGMRLMRLIGSGGMGNVYEALQERPRRSVAVKVIRPELIGSDGEDQFLEEAEILSQLRHPGVTHVYAAGFTEFERRRLAYLVMEYVPGGQSITVAARERDLTLPQRLELFGQVCDAVAHAHAQGVVHRDLKPSNILVDDLGRPKVIDFGIARRVARVESSAEERVMGTLAYLSPEQLLGDERSGTMQGDVYALGVVLYELLVGRRPFAPVSPGFAAAREAVTTETIRPPTQLADNIPAGLEAVTMRCLQKDPQQRYQDASVLAAAVAAEQESIAGVWSVGARGASGGGHADRPAVVAPSPRLSRRTMVSGGVLVGSLAAVAVIRKVAAPRLFADALSKPLPPPALTYDYHDVRQAAPHLVDVTNMKVYREEWWAKMGMPELTYWGPEENDTVGQLIYRFRFGQPVAQILLETVCACHIFGDGQGGQGRGAAAVDASRNGSDWTTLSDGIEPRQWGVYIRAHGALPPQLVGGSEIWIRVRCLTHDCPNDSYSTAQFGRQVHRGEPVFSLVAQRPAVREAQA
jgi:hypothetical protein